MSGLLRPGGRLFLREGHPVLWALDDTRADDLLVLRYPYVERDEPMVFDEAGTYVETEAVFEHNLTQEWNHGLGEIVTALLDSGMEITALAEHDSVPWEALPGLMEQAGVASGGWPASPGGCRTATPCKPSSASDQIPRRNGWVPRPG